MSLLLDALKKSEAQRRRGTSPTIDLTRTPPSGDSGRSGSRRWLILLAGLLLVAAAPWLWPPVSDWIEGRQDGSDDAAALAENAAASAAGPASASRSEVQTGGPPKQVVPAPVAGASSSRSVVAEPSQTAVAGPADDVDQVPERIGDESGKASSDNPGRSAAAVSSSDESAGAANTPAEPKMAGADSEAGSSVQELRQAVQARQEQQQTQAARPSEPAEPSRQTNQPVENFIRPWELPQAERAEFPQLILTVHFYAERAADRFVLINGERYREGQRVGPGAMLAEIRQRGAVVEFGSYRVLIE